MTRKLAIGLALNRLAFGLGFVASPVSSARTWIGTRVAGQPQTQVFTRALGARDVALGLGALRALLGGDEAAARSWMLGHAIADGTDVAATLAARRDLPRRGFAFALAMATASTAIGAWSALALSGDGQRSADRA